MLVVRQKDEKIDELLTIVKKEQIKSDELLALAKEERARADDERAKSDEERRLAEERFIKMTGDARDIQDALEETRTEVIASSETIKNMAKNCVVPSSVPKGKLEVFAVFQNTRTQQFRVACVQWANYNRTLSDYKKECAADGTRVCLKIDYNANAVMFWNSFHKKFESEYMVDRNGRKFYLAPNKTVEDLRNEIIGHCDKQMITAME